MLKGFMIIATFNVQNRIIMDPLRDVCRLVSVYAASVISQFVDTMETGLRRARLCIAIDDAVCTYVVKGLTNDCCWYLWFGVYA